MRPSEFEPELWASPQPGTRAWITKALRATAPDGLYWDHLPPRSRPRGRWTDLARTALLERQNDHCAACIAEFPQRPDFDAGWVYHVDHIVPLSADGDHALSNMQLLCVRCHHQKTAAEHRERPRAVKYKALPLPIGDSEHRQIERRLLEMQEEFKRTRSPQLREQYRALHHEWQTVKAGHE